MWRRSLPLLAFAGAAGMLVVWSARDEPAGAASPTVAASGLSRSAENAPAPEAQPPVSWVEELTRDARDQGLAFRWGESPPAAPGEEPLPRATMREEPQAGFLDPDGGPGREGGGEDISVGVPLNPEGGPQETPAPAPVARDAGAYLDPDDPAPGFGDLNPLELGRPRDPDEG